MAHLQFAQDNTQTKNYKSATKQTHQDRPKMERQTMTEKKQRRHNSTYPKGGVSVSNDSFVGNQH